MKTKALKMILAAVLITAALSGSCSVKKVKQIAVVYDQSKSKIDGCDCLSGMLREILQEKSNEGARITFFKLGEVRDGFEPKIVSVYEVPKNRRITEGKKEFSDKLEFITMDFNAKCRDIPRSDDTPLIHTVSKVASFLKQNGCDENSGCEAIFQTDLQDSFQKASPEKNKAQPPEVVSLDNKSIKFSFYGIAEVVESSGDTKTARRGATQPNQVLINARKREQIKDIWRNMFTSPELIQFFDFCAYEVTKEKAAVDK